MLMTFACVDTRHGTEIHVHRADTDLHPTVLRSHETFYGMPFSELKAAGQGAVHVDDETFACEILQPGDPRLTLEPQDEHIP